MGFLEWLTKVAVGICAALYATEKSTRFLQRLGWNRPRELVGSASKIKEQVDKVVKLNDSLYELYRPKDTVTSMQVVFFHGFQRGSYENAHLFTWLSGDELCIWPQTWLVKEFPDPHILTISYNGGLGMMIDPEQSGQIDMYLFVENLLSDLLPTIGQEPRCPVVLVGHSFGGLVLKRLCVYAFSQNVQSKPGLEIFLDNLMGMFFYATPHHGISDTKISFMNPPRSFRPESPLLTYVKTLSKDTARLNFDFTGLCKRHATWKIAGLGETRASKWGKFRGLVVPEASARDGMNFNMAEAADHISISRPPSKVNRRFTALTQLLKEVAMDSNDKHTGNLQRLPRSITGIEGVLKEVKGKLNKTTRLGFDGMGGIGKTTLAMALFNDLEPVYDYTCFLNCVKDMKDIMGRPQQVEDIILKNMYHRGQKIIQNIGRLKVKMKGKTLLLVVDDVSSERDFDIVRFLTDEFEIPKDRYRFVATSRSKELLASNGFEVHTVPYLSPESSKKFFLICAQSGASDPFQSYVDDIVEKCGGLPLTLQVVGKYLNTKSKECDLSIWKLIVPALEKTKDVGGLEEQLWAKLRLSYDALPKPEKEMFLDATDVFYKSDLTTAKAAWNIITDGFEDLHWRRLVDLSLVWEVRDGEKIAIGMHEQLLDLGRSIGSTSERSGRRIWNDSMKAFKLLSADTVDPDHVKDIVALKSCTRELDPEITGSISGTELSRQNYGKISGSQLCKMTKLQYLWLDGFDIEQTHDSTLPSTIVYLHLSSVNFPFNRSCHSRLTILSLSNISGLRTVPAPFGDLISLQMLTIEGNSDLESLDDSLKSLQKLRHLIVEGCPILKMISDSLGQLQALETLRIDSCESLSMLPNSFGGLQKLKDIRITRCSRLEKLPEKILTLRAIEHIELNETSLLHVPNFKNLKSLKTLRLSWGQTSKFPSLPECLREQVTDRNYTAPLTFSVVDGVLQTDRANNFQEIPTELVGIDQVLVELESNLKSKNSLGLVGMAAIGKTTLAVALFNELARDYEYTCFITGVKTIRAVSEHMHRWGKKISEKERKQDMEFLNGQRLLLMLDGVDVEEEEQIDRQILPIFRAKVLHKESLFVVTSRDFSLCQRLSGNVIHVPLLSQEFSKQLLSALVGPRLTHDVDDIVGKCDGLPLTLEVVGKYLQAESTKHHVVPKDTKQQVVWALDNQLPLSDFDERLWARLRDSYNDLDKVEQNMFLDCATSFFKSDLSTAKSAWSIVTKGQQDIKWQRLVDLSLVWEERIDKDKIQISMQAQLQSLGRTIAFTRGENGLRIWNDSATAFELLSANNHNGDDMKDVIGLKCCRRDLDMQKIWMHNMQGFGLQKDVEEEFEEFDEDIQEESNEDPERDPEKNLDSQNIGRARVLQAMASAPANQVTISGSSLCKMNKLQYLSLEGFDIDEIHDSTLPSTIVCLHLSRMSFSCLPLNPSRHSCLAILSLSNIAGFRNLPESFSQLRSLQILRIKGNQFLKSLPDSFGNLAKLKHLSIERCPKLRSLPVSVGQLMALESLRIGFCDSLVALPESIQSLRKLQAVEIVGCHLESLPDSLGRLSMLKHISIERCPRLRSLPESLGHLMALETLRICFCDSLSNLPESLEYLSKLTDIRLTRCSRLQKLPGEFLGLQALEHIELNETSLLRVPDLTTLESLKTLQLSWSQTSEFPVLPTCLRELVTTKNYTSPLTFSVVNGILRADRPGSFQHISMDIIGILEGINTLGSLPDSLSHLAMRKHLSIERCPTLRRLPDSLGHLVGLESLKINFCDSLLGLPESIGSLGMLKTLKIMGCGLESLPHSLGKLSVLKHLSIERCPFLRLLPESLGQLVALETLRIHYCRSLGALPESVGHLKNLQQLQVKGSDYLKSLHSSVGSLPMLKHLSIEWCPALRRLPDSLGHLVPLESLRIGFCYSMLALPESIGSLLLLQTLQIRGCDLESLPHSLGNLPVLKHLSIERCPYLSSLPESLGQLVALETLRIGFCSCLEALPESTGRLRNLKQLQIDGCDGLKSLQTSLGKLRMLKYLSIERCPALRSLPASLGQLSDLETLRIYFCHSLDALPESTGRLRNLELVQINGCDCLESLPDSLSSLPKLKHVIIKWCPILKLLPKNLGGFVTLETLGIGFCDSLLALPESIGRLQNLQQLEIKGWNHLKSLPDSIGGLAKLKHLIIEECPALRRLPDGLGALVALETLKIGFCHSLAALPESIGDLRTLEEVKILECGCLHSLPETFLQLQGVQRVELKETSLQRIPNFVKLRSLKILGLSWVKTAGFPSLPEGLRKVVTARNYTRHVVFTVWMECFRNIIYRYCQSDLDTDDSLRAVGCISES